MTDAVDALTTLMAALGPIGALVAYRFGRGIERHRADAHPCRMPAPGSHVRVLRPFPRNHPGLPVPHDEWVST